MIPPAFVQELISRVDIVDVVGRHVQLKKGGLNLTGLCPFHSEKSPSFTVSPTKQFYHCFGCGASGDAIRFLTEYSGMGFVDAVKDLAQQVGLTVPEDDVSPQQREAAAAARQRQGTLTQVLAKAAEHYRKQLKAEPRAVGYLKGRGLSGEIAARFGLGYAPEGWKSLASAFADYDDPLLEESGLVILAGGDDADDGSPRKRYDRFRDRVMFPIRSVQGEVIGFGGRVLGQGEPKYLNSPETPVFSKGRELYGLHEARASLRQAGYALVVEGYMDVVALAQLGFPNAVATLGTACTAEHVQKLFRFTDSVVFSFDGDAAGRRAAGRALEAALPLASDTRSVKFLFLPAEHDPDSYVREFGADGFQRCIDQAVPLSRQLLVAAGQGCDLGAAEGRARLLANARPLWSSLPDGALKRQLLGELASLATLGADDLSGLWGLSAAPSRANRPAAGGPPARAPRRTRQGAANLLDRALWLLVHRAESWGELDAASHDMLAEQAPPYGELFAIIERGLMEHGPQAPAAVLAQLRDDIAPNAPAADVTAAGESAGTTAVDRIAALHAPDPSTDLRAELGIVIDRLRLRAVEDELTLLFESGALSPDAQSRGIELMRSQALFKAALAGGAGKPEPLRSSRAGRGSAADQASFDADPALNDNRGFSRQE